MLYTTLLVLLLTVIEETIPPHVGSRSSLSAPSETGFIREDQPTGFEASVQQHIFQGNPPRRSTGIYRRSFRYLAKITAAVWTPIHALAWHTRREAGVTTRNIFSATRHLRYYSGSSYFFTRGLLVYLVYYRLIPDLMEAVVDWILSILQLMLVSAYNSMTG